MIWTTPSERNERLRRHSYLIKTEGLRANAFLTKVPAAVSDKECQRLGRLL